MKNALHYYEEMKRNNYAPTQTSFKLMIDGFAAQGDTTNMIKYLDRMQMYSLAPDAHIFNSLIEALGRTKSVPQLKMVVKKLESRRVILSWSGGFRK